MNGLVIADAGPIFSLALIDKLELLNDLFDDVLIPQAVWEEISRDDTKPFYKSACEFFKDKVKPIVGYNDLTSVMDFGESESVILYREIGANFLLIDDKKARSIAEHLGITCIGILGLLVVAKEKGLIAHLRPIFIDFLKNGRFYSIDLLNNILAQKDEEFINF